MLLRHHSPNGPRDVQVDVDDPDATIADLAVALDPTAPTGPLLVDGRTVPAATPLDRAGVGHGATVAPAGPAPGSNADGKTGGPVEEREEGEERDRPVVTVTVVGGLDAGRAWDLPPGRHPLGRRDRSPSAGSTGSTGSTGSDPTDRPLRSIADPTVSRCHAVLVVAADGVVTVEDAGSTNGTFVDGERLGSPRLWPIDLELRCGASTIRHRPRTAPARRRAPDGPPPWPWHRRPIPPAALDDRAPVEPPGDPEPPPPVSPVGLVAILGSLAVGGAMVVLLGSWLYAAFALLGPVLVLAGAVDARIRRRRAGRQGGRRRRAALGDLARTLDARREEHVARLEAWHPGPAAAAARAPAVDDPRAAPLLPGDELWSTRTGAPDAHRVRLGTGATTWTPPVAGDPRRWPDDVRAVVDRCRTIDPGPVTCSLRDGPIAIVGPSEARCAVARSIVTQAVTAHGPAELALAAIIGAADAGPWSWLGWLPHAVDPVAGSLLAVGRDDGWRVAAAVADRIATGSADGRPAPVVLVLIDDAAGLLAARSAARTVLRAALDPSGPDDGRAACRPVVTPIVLVRSRADAPPGATIVEVGADGTLTGPTDLVDGPAVAMGVALDVAAAVARTLGRFVDPERDDPGRGLPDVVRLAPLLGTESLTPAGIAARWSVGGHDPAPTALLGRSVEGPLTIDLAADGPHTLVAGTTGAGKSELLRALVTSLAVRSSPRHLNLVLIDYKGGSAFDACARLPHTAGVVTDLDEHLAARALRCLDAELRHRERCLRATGSSDLAAHRAALAGSSDRDLALPRLVVVVDEFATLAAELPEFVDALVGIAQRGRSLGVHLVLATQRPGGAVSDNIRANTALRIALRVQDPGDSVDVVGSPIAADLPRTRPGRAVVRLGPRDLVTVQTAWTGACTDAGDGPIRVRPLRIGAGAAASATNSATGQGSGGPIELAVIVEAIADAWSLVDGRPARRPWPEPLPTTFDLTAPARDVDRDEGPPDDLLLGLADDPDRQRQVPYRWPPDESPLLIVGRPSVGSTAGLATATLAAASRWAPDALHVHVIDLGTGVLGPIAGLPHVGALVGPDELERQRRLIADLGDDLAERRARPQERRPRRLLVVNRVDLLRERWDDLEASGTWTRFVEVVTQGSPVGIHAALTVDGAAHLPATLVSACRRRLVLRPADGAEAIAHGIAPTSIPDLPPGRGLDPEGPILVQLGTYGRDLGAAVAGAAARWGDAPATAVARPIEVLPDLVLRSSLPRPTPAPGSTGAAGGDGSLRLTVGISDVGLATADLVLAPGGHALVAGPPRSGRTTALRSLGAAAVDAGLDVVLVTVGAASVGRTSGGAHRSGIRSIGVDDPVLAELVDTERPLLLLVDDADLSDPEHPVLSAVARHRRPHRHLVAAARSDRARTAYSHWLREVRVDRCGLLLCPDADLDGELLGCRLPRQPLVAPAPGRGWLVGEPEGFAHVAVTTEGNVS